MAQIIRIAYLPSVKSGEELGKQLRVTTDCGTFFQSYNTIIAKVWKDGGNYKVLLSSEWESSKTTKTYTAKFLSDYVIGIYCAHDVELAIKTGRFEVVDRPLFFED